MALHAHIRPRTHDGLAVHELTLAPHVAVLVLGRRVANQVTGSRRLALPILVSHHDFLTCSKIAETILFRTPSIVRPIARRSCATHGSSGSTSSSLGRPVT